MLKLNSTVRLESSQTTRPDWFRDDIEWVFAASREAEKFPRLNLQLQLASNSQLPIMSSRPAWRALHHSAKRRAFQPATPYRCFSCTRQTQNQSKSEQDRMTHFGFTNVPESEKESRGKLSISSERFLRTNWNHRLTATPQSAPSSAPSHPPTTE